MPLTSLVAAVLGTLAVLAWRIQESRRAVSTRSIVIPPMGMSTGFSMFMMPAFRVPWLWGVVAFVLGALALYFAKTIVAQIIGRRLFRGPAGEPHYAATLLAGLAIVTIAVNIPFIGPILNLVATLIGLGLIVTVIYARFSRGATV